MDAKTWCYYCLYEWAKAYAEYERICELSKTAPDTTELDNSLRAGDMPIVATFYVNGKPIEGKKYPSIITVSQDRVISQITVKEGEKWEDT